MFLALKMALCERRFPVLRQNMDPLFLDAVSSTLFLMIQLCSIFYLCSKEWLVIKIA